MKSGNTIAAQLTQLPLNKYNCRSTNTIAAQLTRLPLNPATYMNMNNASYKDFFERFVSSMKYFQIKLSDDPHCVVFHQ